MRSLMRMEWRRTLGTTRPTWTEVVWVTSVLVAIQVLMFWGYYKGATSPSGDFFASYNTEAYAWWRDGGILHPPAWMPYTWGGFPAAAQVQNSAWYLPTGLMSAFGWYDITGAAVQQALHVAVAGTGVYVLARRGGFGRVASTFGLIAYSMTTGFFTEAPYPDIVRGFALVPWILLCLSPLWPWHRRWSVPAAAILLWQATVGIYPGVLVAIAYSGLAWLIAWQLVRRPPLRAFLAPLAVAGVLAVLLSLPKYLPQLGLNTIARGDIADLSVFSPSTLATIVLPGYIGMPGVYSLNQLFVPAAALLLAALTSLRRTITKVAWVTLIVGALLAVPQSPLRGLSGILPGIASSRFRLNDYLPILFLAGVVAAMSGLEALYRNARGPLSWRVDLLRGIAVVVPVSAAFAILSRGPFQTGDWIPTTAVLAVTTVVVIVALLVRHRLGGLRLWRWSAGATLAVVAAASGIAHAATVTELWKVDTVAAQQEFWGATSGVLMDHYVTQEGPQRAARVDPGPLKQGEDLGSRSYLAGFYTGVSTVGGYFSVHQSASFVESGQAMRDPKTAEDARAIWSAPGILITAESTEGGLPDAADTRSCSGSGQCGSLTLRPVHYSSGNLTYEVSARGDQAVLANEAYYPGWSVLLTDVHGKSFEARARLGPAGLTEFDVPDGTWRVSMVYSTPLMSTALVAFWCGLIAVCLLFAVDPRDWMMRRRAAFVAARERSRNE